MKSIRILAVTAFALFLISGCIKDSGEGGSSTIIGKVYAYDYNAEMTQLRNQYYAPDEDVYIIYGGDSIFNDRTRTNHDGFFRFEYLRPGTYTIFVYSKNLETKLPPNLAITKQVEITESNQVIVVDDIEIIK